MTIHKVNKNSTNLTCNIDNKILTQRVNNACKDIFLYIPNQLKELDLVGRSTLFQFTQTLLIDKQDSNIIKTIKVSLTIFPIIPIIIGTTFLVDNLLKVFKSNKLNDFEKDFNDTTKDISINVNAKIEDVLTRYGSSEFKDLEKKIAGVVEVSQNSKECFKKLVAPFYQKIQEQETLCRNLEASINDLKNIQSLISHKKHTREEIINSISSLKYTFYSNLGSFSYPYNENSDIESTVHQILNEITNIKHDIFQLANKCTCEGSQYGFGQKEAIFDSLETHYEDLISTIDEHCKDHEEKKSLILNHSPEDNYGIYCINRDTNQYIADAINKYLSLLEEVCNNQLKQYQCQDLLYNEENRDLVYPKTFLNNKTVLTNAFNLINEYKKVFPSKEKEEICDFIKSHNLHIDLNDKHLLKKANYKNVTIRYCHQQLLRIQSLINTADNKLILLKTLPDNHPLKERFLTSFMEKKEKLLDVADNLKKTIKALIPWEEKLSSYSARLDECKIPNLRSTSLENAYNECCNIYRNCTEQLMLN